MYILSIDQGTTGTTSAIYDRKGRIVARVYREFPQIYPQPGWVEHDPDAIWNTVVDTVTELLDTFPHKISAIGITNQRETTILWDRITGKPLHNAIVWQCRRTAPLCEELREHESLIRDRTGLPLDAYFSGTKIKWILDNSDDYSIENVLFGTVDTWLIWKLTGGTVHATDYTNASRTLLFNLETKTWDDGLCKITGVPRSLLPEIKSSMDDYGAVRTIPGLKGVPVLSVAGDQQAALFGQTCFDKGSMKNTYGTGCFLLMNTGDRLVRSDHGLISTIAVAGNGEPCYALEGSIFIAGAAIQWLRDEIDILDSAQESEKAALSVDDNGGVYLVPAFTGLGAPYWDMDARGTLAGLTRGSNRNHIIRAALEAMAYQTYDVFTLMEKESGATCVRLAVDGGAAANNFLMQFQADLLDRIIERPAIIESTSLGAAYMAGLHAGVWKNSGELTGLKERNRTFTPSMDTTTRDNLIQGWQKAVRQARQR